MKPGTRVEVLVCVSRSEARFRPGTVLPSVYHARYSVQLEGGGVVHGIKPESMRVIVREAEQEA